MAEGQWKNISLNANNAFKESCKFSSKFAIKKLLLVMFLKIKTNIYT